MFSKILTELPKMKYFVFHVYDGLLESGSELNNLFLLLKSIVMKFINRNSSVLHSQYMVNGYNFQIAY